MTYIYERSLYWVWILFYTSMSAIIIKVVPIEIIASLINVCILIGFYIWVQRVGLDRITKQYSLIEDVLTAIVPMVLCFYSFAILPVGFSISAATLAIFIGLQIELAFRKMTKSNTLFIKDDQYKPQELWTIAWPTFVTNIFLVVTVVLYAVVKS